MFFVLLYYLLHNIEQGKYIAMAFDFDAVKARVLCAKDLRRASKK